MRKKDHFIALDGMRGIAAMAVVLFHRREWTRPNAFEHAYLAVDFFFLLSGFVIAFAYGDRLNLGRLTFRQYLTARVIRLYPLIVLGAVMGTIAQILRAIIQNGDPLRIALNFPFAVLALPAPPLITDKPFAINEPTWSLFFEFVANIVFAAAATLAPRRALLPFLCGCFVTFIVMLGCVGAKVGFNYSDFLWGFVRVSFPFALGVGIFNAWKMELLPRFRLPYWFLVLSLVAIFLVPNTRFDRIFDGIAIAILFPLVVVAGINCRLSERWSVLARESGRLSYPLYALHIPMMVVLGTVFDALGMSGWPKLICVALVIALTCYVIGRWADEPFRAWLAAKMKPDRGEVAS